MKRFTIILAALFAITNFVSCDKIEPDENGNYVTYSGAAGTWEDGSPVADHTHRAFLEKYTGPKCNNCPKGDEKIHEAMEEFGDKFIPVSIHDYSNFGTPVGANSPDLRTEVGNRWSKFFGIIGYPSALINRQKDGSGAWDVFAPTSSLITAVNTVVDETAKIAVEVNAAYDEMGDVVSITTGIEFLEDISEQLTLTVLVIEDSIIAGQIMPDLSENLEYVHNHIFRAVVTDAWGFPVDAGEQTTGTAKKLKLRYKMNPAWKMEHCHIVAFVSYYDSRCILNSAQCAIATE